MVWEGMRHPATHNFLKWFGPSIVVFFGGCIGLIASLASVFPGVKAEAERWYSTAGPVVISPWFVFLVAILIAGYLTALIWTGRPRLSEPDIPAAPIITGTPDPHEAIRRDIERARLEAERADALASVEFRRGLDAYVRGEPRAPPPLPEIGTPGAAVFGVDGPRTAAVIDVKNFGQGTAINVRYRAVCGIFPQKPHIPEAFDKSGVLGRCEPDHTQNIQFIFESPVTSAEVASFRRDGTRALYAIAEIRYEDEAGESYIRRMGYYLDPLAPTVDGRLMMSICDVGEAQ